MKRFRLLKKTRQTTEYSCGACALQSVLSYWGRDVDEADLMRLLGTTPEEGTYPEAIVRVAHELGFQAELKSDLTIDELARASAEGHPVIVLGQVWRSQKPAESSFEDEWDSGHWFIVLAIDERYVYFEDPYMRMGKGFVPRATFEAAWHNVMGGDRSKPVQMHMGIFIRGDRPAPQRAAELDAAHLDFAKFGSLNLIVTQFRGNILPYDFVTELKDITDSGLIRPDAFVFLVKDAHGGLMAIGGGRLEDDTEIAEINAVIAALSGMGEKADAQAIERAHSAVHAAALGDFGLPETELLRIGEKIPPGESAIIVLFENLWERRFREVAARYQGSVTGQRLITSETLARLGEALRGKAVG